MIKTQHLFLMLLKEASLINPCLSSYSRRKKFLAAFCSPSESSSLPPLMIGISQAALDGLQKALHNLSTAEEHFAELSQETTFHSILPKKLYSKITSVGFGKKITGAKQVR